MAKATLDDERGFMRVPQVRPAFFPRATQRPVDRPQRTEAGVHAKPEHVGGGHVPSSCATRRRESAMAEQPLVPHDPGQIA